MIAEHDIRTAAANWAHHLGVPEKVTTVAEFASAPPRLRDGDRGSIFRGEPEIFPSFMAPSLIRESFGDITALRNLEISEISEARDTYSSNLIKDRFLNAFAPMMHGDDLNWLFFARHVGKKTRLLDVTRNPLVALFFATGGSLEVDGVVYITLSSNFRPVRRGREDPGSSQNSPKMPISYKELLDQSFDSGNTHDKPYLIFPELPQERILAQSGGFFFWKNPSVNFHDMRQAFPVIVDGSAKENMRRELESFGISEDVLFPNG